MAAKVDDLVKRALQLDQEAKDLGLRDPTTVDVLNAHIQQHEKANARERDRRDRAAETAKRVAFEDPEDKAFYAPAPQNCMEVVFDPGSYREDARESLMEALKQRTGFGRPVHSFRLHPRLGTIRFFVKPGRYGVTGQSVLIELQAQVHNAWVAREQNQELQRVQEGAAASLRADAPPRSSFIEPPE